MSFGRRGPRRCWGRDRPVQLNQASRPRLTARSQGIVALRTLLVDGRGSIPTGGDGGLLWLTGTSAAYLLIGIAAFSLGERWARQLGSLARY